MDVPSIALVAVHIAIRLRTGAFGPLTLLGAPAFLLVLEAAAGLRSVQPPVLRRVVGSLPVLAAIVSFGFSVVASRLLAAAPAASGAALAVSLLVVLELAAALLAARAAITLISTSIALLVVLLSASRL